jgi:hypothetical protein
MNDENATPEVVNVAAAARAAMLARSQSKNKGKGKVKSEAVLFAEKMAAENKKKKKKGLTNKSQQPNTTKADCGFSH